MLGTIRATEVVGWAARLGVRAGPINFVVLEYDSVALSTTDSFRREAMGRSAKAKLALTMALTTQNIGGTATAVQLQDTRCYPIYVKRGESPVTPSCNRL